ncbi:ROK family protein [Saccharothrix lopnurensis]|uniref:ROK family protein n=1 Tax=Saccharothrix lopnurensis TaxID=1670621 RepID=A0ABW1PE03_9PSEU
MPDLARRLALDPAADDFLTEFARIAAAANAGDPEARGLVERSARHPGHAAVTVAVLFDLGAIVPAGQSFAVAGPIHQAVVRQEPDHRLFARAAPPGRVVPSVNGSEAAAIGGVVLVPRSGLVLGRGRSEDGTRPVPAGAP